MAQDYGLWQKLLMEYKLICLSQVLHKYRFHASSISRHSGCWKDLKRRSKDVHS